MVTSKSAAMRIAMILDGAYAPDTDRHLELAAHLVSRLVQPMPNALEWVVATLRSKTLMTEERSWLVAGLALDLVREAPEES